MLIMMLIMMMLIMMLIMMLMLMLLLFFSIALAMEEVASYVCFTRPKTKTKQNKTKKTARDS